jgi:hypothetical protein
MPPMPLLSGPLIKTKLRSNTLDKLRSPTCCLWCNVHIAERARSIPDTIYRLFRSVIDARLKVHPVFKQATEKSPDADVEKSNVGHKHFIDVLEEAFKVLGGETWSTKQNDRQKTSGDESLDEVIFANAFDTLDLGEDVDEESANDSDENMVCYAKSGYSLLLSRTSLSVMMQSVISQDASSRSWCSMILLVLRTPLGSGAMMTTEL